jgi:hypothetical protein
MVDASANQVRNAGTNARSGRIGTPDKLQFPTRISSRQLLFPDKRLFPFPSVMHMPKINLLEVTVVEFGGRQDLDKPPVLHDPDPGARLLGAKQVVGRHQNRDPAR